MDIENIEYKTDTIEAFYKNHRIRWDEFYESERVVFSRLGLGPNVSVLDIGCGCGGLGFALKEKFGIDRYFGVEINLQAAETAKVLNPKGQFVVGDIMALSSNEVAPEGFDMVVSLGCIDWNIRFSDMLEKAYSYVRHGGWFVSSFRLTPEPSVIDITKSYQYINFESKQEGEVAPYVVLNSTELLSVLRGLKPARIEGMGYWGTPSATAATPFNRICFTVIAVQKSMSDVGSTSESLDFPEGIIPVGDPSHR